MNQTKSLKGVWRGLSVLVLFAMLLAACQPAPTPVPTLQVEPTNPPPAPTEPPLPTPTPDFSAQLQNQLWVLVASGDPASPAVVTEGIKITATFNPDGTVSGSGGCNNYTGGYTLAGDQISVGPLASTMMFCETGSQEETAYLAALQQAKTFAFSPEGRLQIFYDPGDGTKGVLVYAIGQVPLVGTNWVLLALGSPDAPTKVEPGTVITAVFYDDGSLTGQAGCNTYVAGYTIQDSSLTVSQPASTMMMCTIGMEQESAYLTSLSKAESYTISGPVLQITANGGAEVLTFTSLSLPLEYTLWTLASFAGAPAGEATPLTMQFIPGEDATQGTVGGVVVCNNYNAGYTLDGTNLTITNTATTFMACPPETVATEQAYLAAINGAQSYQILANQMLLTTSEGQMSFVADRTPLLGSNWILTAMGDATNPTAPAEGAQFNAFFTRQPGSPSGLLQGRSGCNEYNSTFVASLSEIKINQPATTRMACPSPVAEQETEYLNALTSASQYAIIGDVLKIPYGEGKMLSFKAYPVEAVPQVDLRPLQGTFWWLISINNQAILAGSQITAQFFVNADAVSGSVSGLAGCNNYTAQISDGFKVGPAATTMKTCSTPQGVMEQEQLYLSQLQQATGYSMSGGQLIIPTSTGVLVYSSTAPANTPPVTPTSLLVNRIWYLKAMGDENAIAGSEPTANFASNGTLSGYTGCNNYSGTFTTNGNDISVGALSIPKSSCPEPQLTQEFTYISWLGSAARFEVNDTQMRIYTKDNEVLYFQSTPPKPVEPDDPDPVDPPVDNNPPTAIIDAPRQAEVGQDVTFDGSGSQSAVEITAYKWDFGDGTQADGATLVHSYASTGDYNVVLTVTDANNLSNSTTYIISIVEAATPTPPPPPVAVIIAPPTGDSATPVTFDGTASTSDAGITNFHWDMGDGTVFEGPFATYTFPQPGNFIVTLTVMDAYGQTSTTTWPIMIYAAVVAAPPEVTQPIATPEPVATEPVATPTP